MIRALALAAAAAVLAGSVVPATAAPTRGPQRAQDVVVAKDQAHDADRGAAWENASPRTRRAADLRKVSVGASPRGEKFTRFVWRTSVVQKRRPDVARTYSTFASTPESDARVEMRLVQVNKYGGEALLFVKGDTSDCLYAKGAPRVAFSPSARTVSLDVRTACLRSATGDEGGLRLDRGAVQIKRERTVKDRVIGTDSASFGADAAVTF